MSRASTRRVAAAVVAAAAVGGIGAYWYYSPYLAVRAMHSAAERKDADAFNAYVDYPKLRESLKVQMATLMSEKLADAPASSQGFDALGSALALALVNPMIDAMVRPEFVMNTMAKGELDVGPTSTHAISAEPAKDPKWEFERVGANTLLAFAVDPEGKDGTRAGVVFARSGFDNWKLTELRLPGAAP